MTTESNAHNPDPLLMPADQVAWRTGITSDTADAGDELVDVSSLCDSNPPRRRERFRVLNRRS